MLACAYNTDARTQRHVSRRQIDDTETQSAEPQPYDPKVPRHAAIGHGYPILRVRKEGDGRNGSSFVTSRLQLTDQAHVVSTAVR